MADPGSFDDELRRMARRSTEETAAATDVDAELAAVQGRVAGPVSAARPPVDRRLVWFSAAAATVLVVGVVAAIATRDRGTTLQTAGEGTSSIVPTVTATTTDATATVIVASTTSLPPVATTTSVPATTTTPPASTVADEAAPPPATTVVPVAVTTTTTSTVPQNECWMEPVPPPSLADGSPVGEPVVADADKGRGTETFTWGEGDFAITQVVGERPDASGLPDTIDIDEWGERHGDWRGFSENASDGAVAAWLINDADGCRLRYEVEPGFQHPVIDRMTGVWAANLGTGTPIPDGLHPELPAPTSYFSSRSTADGRFDAYEFDPEGVPAGPVSAGDVVDFPVDLGDAGRARLDGDRLWFECTGAPIAATDPAIVEAVEPIGSVQSIAGSSSGVVVVIRQECADGTWWNERSSAEILRVEPGVSVEAIKEIRPIDESYAGRWWAHTVSPDGRFAGVSESTSIETWRYHVLDMLGRSTSSEPLELTSSCDDAREIVGVPRFLDGGLVVLARACGGSPILVGNEPTLVVDVVDLETGAVVWGAEVEHGDLSDSYTGTIDGISAALVDGEVWILVTSGGFEHPGRTMLVSENAQAEVTRLGPFRNYAFRIEDLLIN